MSRRSRFLLEGSAADPLIVQRSAYWGFNAVALFDGQQACVIDPGLTASEVLRLKERARHAPERAGEHEREVSHVILTHAHHDHMRGWMAFPGSEVVFPRVAAEKGEVARSRILAAKRKLDDHFDDPCTGFEWPRATLVFDDVLDLRVGALDVQMRFLPGHSNCTSVVWIPALKTLVSADYLVTPGMPYCRWQAKDFEVAIETLTTWTQEEGIERVIPAHQDILVGQEAILAALAEERDYMSLMRALIREQVATGTEQEPAVRRVAKAMVKRRGSDLGGRRQDIDNARRIWDEES